MTIHSLLLKIENSVPINFDQLCKKLPKSSQWQQLFTVEPVGKSKHLVTVKDQQAFTILLNQTKNAENRKQAAAHEYLSSHHVKCSSAYMLCYPAQTRLALSVVGLKKNELLPLSFKPGKHAILIENQDCFFEWQTLLSHFTLNTPINNCDIYFSAGSRVINSAFSNILKQYQTLYCCFDYDLAGLNTSLALHKQYTNVSYLVPENILTLKHLFTFLPNSTKDLAEMLALCEKVELFELQNTISQSKCFMEQEALLTIDKTDTISLQ